MKYTSKRDWQPPARNWKAYLISISSVIGVSVASVGSIQAYDYYAHSHQKTVAKDYHFHQDDINLVKNALDPILAAQTITVTGTDATAKNLNPRGVNYTITSQAIIGRSAAFGYLYPIDKMNFRHIRLIMDNAHKTYLKTDSVGAKTVVPLIYRIPVNQWISGGNVLENLFREPKKILAVIESNAAKSIWKDDTQTVFTSGNLTITLPNGTDPSVTVVNPATSSTAKISAASQTVNYVRGTVFAASKEYNKNRPLPFLYNVDGKIKVRKMPAKR